MLQLFEGRVVVRWISKELRRGRRRGWSGEVISGWRSRAHQARAAREYAARRGLPVSALYPNGVQASNHRGTRWPYGAVDVTMPEELARALSGPEKPWRGRRLRWAIEQGHNDRTHFSASGF